jgi:FAD/FMN-containing dehydrogenase
MNAETLATLTAGLHGRVIAPGDGAFEEARTVWNGTISKRPGLIVRCRTVEDVIEAVNFAREQGFGVSVRGGGHHVAGAAVLENGMVIDLSEMRSVSVDVAGRTVKADGGALLVDVDDASLPHNLAVPTGLFSETGIGGLTLAGGYSWLRRQYGLACDNLISAEVVTADGRLITASATENPDLFWALRGGGWDLGVVTAFEYRAHVVPAEIFMVFCAYPVSDAARVLAAFDAFMKTAPRETAPLAVIWTFPDSEAYPEEIWNQPFVGVIGPYVGDVDEGKRLFQPLRELGDPMFDGSDVLSFADVQHAFDEDYPKGRRYYWKSSYLKALTPEALAATIEVGNRRPSPLTSLDLWPLGGAIQDVGPDASPVGHRESAWLVGIESNWEGAADDAANIAWAREAQTRLAPFSTGGSYLNFEDLSETARVEASHGGNFARLVEVKHKYDPNNLFRSRKGLID